MSDTCIQTPNHFISIWVYKLEGSLYSFLLNNSRDHSLTVPKGIRERDYLSKFLNWLNWKCMYDSLIDHTISLEPLNNMNFCIEIARWLYELLKLSHWIFVPWQTENESLNNICDLLRIDHEPARHSASSHLKLLNWFGLPWTMSLNFILIYTLALSWSHETNKLNLANALRQISGHF